MYCPVRFVIISYLILNNVVIITETIVFLFIKCQHAVQKHPLYHELVIGDVG